MSKITSADALSIRSSHADGGAPVAALARHYKVHPSVIENLLAGRTFRDPASFPEPAA